MQDKCRAQLNRAKKKFNTLSAVQERNVPLQINTDTCNHLFVEGGSKPHSCQYLIFHCGVRDLVHHLLQGCTHFRHLLELRDWFSFKFNPEEQGMILFFGKYLRNRKKSLSCSFWLLDCQTKAWRDQVTDLIIK